MKNVFLSIVLITVFLNWSGVYGQTVHKISSGENKIDDAVFNANSGDIIELTTNGGYYHEFFSIVINVPLTIRAAQGLEVKPIWICDDIDLIIELRNNLTLKGIQLDGSFGDNSTMVGVKIDSLDPTLTDYILKIDNCEFTNFTQRAIYAHPSSQADSVVITNSLFAHIDERAIYYKDPLLEPGSVQHFILGNCTFFDIGEDIIYVGDHDNNILTAGPEFFVDHITIHDPGMSDPDIKSIYPKFIDIAVIKNSIVTRSDFNESTTPARIYGTNSILEYFLYWNTGNISLKDNAAIDSAKVLENIDPLYFDASVGDLTLSENSPAIGSGENGTNLGDLRWSEYNRVTIDGLIGEWPDWTRLDTGAVNDPTLHDTTEFKAVWFTFDSNKVALRADFFGPCDWRGGQTSGTWNINSGALRFYFYDPIGNKWRIRLYQNSVDSSYTSAKLLLESGPDYPGVNSGRIDGIANWNEAGSSVEMFFPCDSIAFPTSQWHPDSTLRARFWCLDGWGGQTSRLPDDGSYYWFKVGDVDFNIKPTSVEEYKIGDYVPIDHRLFQNYPNPFNPVTNITYSISKAENVQIFIFNTLGQKIATLVNKKQTAGKHTLQWNTKDDQGYKMASGVYYYQLRAGNFVATKKMLLLK